jgi:hypothetical protein
MLNKEGKLKIEKEGVRLLNKWTLATINF